MENRTVTCKHCGATMVIATTQIVKCINCDEPIAVKTKLRKKKPLN